MGPQIFLGLSDRFSVIGTCPLNLGGQYAFNFFAHYSITSGDARTTGMCFKKLNSNKNFKFIKTQIEQWVKWRKDWEPTNLDQNRASPLAAITVLDGSCNWINPGESLEQTMDNKKRTKNQIRTIIKTNQEKKKKFNEKPWICGPACWSRCSRRRRVWTQSHGPDAASTVASVETVSRRRSPAAGLGRLPLPPPRRP